jgi:pyrimidine operon attenuation protein/uracil phosphoribosyltransferase
LKILLQKEKLNLTIQRLAHQIVEDLSSLDDVVFIGLQPRGIFVAERMVDCIKEITGISNIKYGVLDITFYRDDVRNELHTAQTTQIDFPIAGKKVVLIDDVLFTGRTIRAAFDALQDFGRPSSIELAVLVNRQFQREIPIQPTYFGMAVNTNASEKIKADWDKEEIYVYE